MQRAAAWDAPARTPAQGRLAGVILDEIACLPEAPLALPMPADTRVRKVATAMLADLSDTRNLEGWAALGALSARTLSRLFVLETGLSFTAWRQRARLLKAMELLAAGRPVTAVALDLGYDNTSAFIALFRRAYGCTPGQYPGPAPIHHA